MKIKRIKIHPPHNPKPSKNLDRTISKNFLGEQLVRPMYKFTKSVTEINSKRREAQNLQWGNQWSYT